MQEQEQELAKGKGVPTTSEAPNYNNSGFEVENGPPSHANQSLTAAAQQFSSGEAIEMSPQTQKDPLSSYNLAMQQSPGSREGPSSDEMVQPSRRRNGAGRTRAPKYKKVKSLGNFCQQFIKQFVTKREVLSLEEAAKNISDNDNIDEKMLKTKIRRLYDIANVLQSLGLIAKTQMSNSRKPAFRWVGLKGVVVAI